MAEERSVSDVLQAIARDLHDMVRAEIRLVKVEMREEVRRAVSSSVWFGAGAVGAASAWIFLLWTWLRTRDQDADVGRNVGHRVVMALPPPC